MNIVLARSVSFLFRVHWHTDGDDERDTGTIQIKSVNTVEQFGNVLMRSCVLNNIHIYL